MDDLFLLSEAQMRRIERFFPLSHGIPRVDDRRIISGIVFAIKNGLRWRDAPRGYGPHKTIYIGLCDGAVLACSTRSSRSWHARLANLDG